VRSRIKILLREAVSKEASEETLWDNDWFSVIEKTDKDGASMTGLKPKGGNVVVLPYIIEDGEVIKIGVHHEVNPLWGDGTHSTAITGGIEDGESDLESAKRELEEESGYTVDEDDKWISLGSVKPSKLLDLDQPCFAVDVTGLEIGEAKKDGTINEELSNFEMMPIDEILSNTNDTYLPTLYLKLTRHLG
jgi:8-oxo-dGTP pyrophosphatase MutT (NUDIX family)